MLVSEKGQMVTGRMVPKTVLIKSFLQHNTLTLSFPQAREIHIKLDQVEAKQDKRGAK